MKRSRLQPSSILNCALVVALAVITATTLRSQPQVTAAQLASLTPLALTNCLSQGNYYYLHGPAPDQPYPPLPSAPLDLPGETPVYDLGGGYFLIDDSAVDWNAVWQQREIDSAINDLEVQYGLRAGPAGGRLLRPMQMNSYTSDDLWFEITCLTNYTANFIVHPPDAEATNGVYDLFMTTSLSPGGGGLNLTNWFWVLRTDPGETNLVVPGFWMDAAYFLLGRTNDADGDGMSDAYELLVTHTDPNTTNGPVITSQPLSQAVYSGDTVTFSVAAEGAQPLSYQWGSNGVPLVRETNAALTLAAVQPSGAADYSVLVTSPLGLSTLSSNATLTVYDSSGMGFIPVIGPRQDFTFRRGPTYLIYSPVELYGHTVIQGASVIKFATWTNSTLQVKGSLTTETVAYSPGILTSMDDNSVGIPISNSSGSPLTASNHCAYLDLSGAQRWQPPLSNLRLSYADQGVTTPIGAATLDLWHCQFWQCASAVVNAVTNGPASARFHNVLFAACQSAVLVVGSEVAITGEHITADLESFWTGQAPPVSLRLTNSIIIGSITSGPELTTNHCALNPVPPVFQPNAAGGYYLTNDSPYQTGGTTNITASLLADLRQKTTQPPLAFPNQTILKGELTLLPRVARGGGGTLALGYHYDALDYTVATLTLQGANVTVEPGTAIAVRYDPWPDTPGYFSYIGFDLCNGARLVGCGTPTRPVTFTTVQLVQEQPCPLNYCVNLLPDLPLDGDTPPTLDFRFCNFYFGSQDYQVLAGMTSYYEWTPSDNSSLNWTLRDCSLRGGAINLGYPGSYFDEMLPPGSVCWVNNVFEWVDINLDPTYYWISHYYVNVDLPFQASNNLFRGGRLRIVPMPTSAGNWSLRDNLFEWVVFQQDTDMPLDHDHNAYWPCSQSELDAAWVESYGPGSTRQLGADTGGTNYPASDPTLTAAPPYQAGPFGDYYLPTATALYNAGSRTASDTSLHHYTTRVDQIKEGDELSGHMVNIGVHYIAATNSVPKDSDGDGIPDYVENWHGDGAYSVHTDTETDWHSAYTVSGVYDPTNSVYDDIDLSGDGLVGRVKKALGMSPFDPSNPLQLNQLITGDEPQFVTFEVPISYGLLTNIGGLNLHMNGLDVTLEACDRATNGNTILAWNSAYDPPLQHYLQLQLTLTTSAPDNAILSGCGSLTSFYSSNVLRFFESDALYDDSGAYLDAQLAAQNADYTIELYDPSTTPPTLLRTITSSTSNGMIQEDWDLTCDNSTNLFAGSAFDAVFDVTLLDQQTPGAQSQRLGTSRLESQSAHGTSTKRHGKIVTTEQGNGFDVAYMYTPPDNALTSAFSMDGPVWVGMQGVVDILCQPSLLWQPYGSSFDTYSCPSSPWGYPGYITSRATITNALYPSLADGLTKSFYCYAHGNSNWLGNAAGDVFMKPAEVARSLTNYYVDPNPRKPGQGGLVPANPYRFVFLDGCATASANLWRRAFGIMPLWAADQAARQKLGAQAYVGWASASGGALSGLYFTNGVLDMAGSRAEESAYTATLQCFFFDWMNGASLYQCITNASDTNVFACPLQVEGVKTFTIGQPFTSTSFTVTNKYPSKIYVVGHSGLTKGGLRPEDDRKLEAPKNIQ